MKPRPIRRDIAHDNTAAGRTRRAEYAENALLAEARIVAADVGPVMAACALVGVAERIARESGIPRRSFESLLIDMLQRLNRSEAP